MADVDPTPDLEALGARLDGVAAQLEYLVERQRKQEELFEELMPIARLAMSSAIGRLDDLEQKGYLAFVREVAGVGQKVVEGFSPADVRQLGDAVVGILDTVRRLTQPDMLRVAADASEAIEDADKTEPLGIFGMARATRNPDVQRGMAVMMEVLRRVGHGVNALTAKQLAADDRKAKLAELLGPKRARKALGTERPRLPAGGATAPVSPAKRPAAPAGPPANACAVPARPQATATVIDGIAFGADGHMIDATAWTPALGVALATAQGVTLTPAHQAVLEAARADFAATKASPNIRRLTQVAGVTTRDLYTLFPKAPARTICKVAGLPKPAGCL